MTKRTALLASLLALCLMAQGATVLPSDSVLRRYAAQMLMVGFRGNSIDAQSDAARYVRDLKVGAIILFDVDLTGSATVGSRNVTSRGQLACLTHDLRAMADYPLLIALDQEGGKVARMKVRYGFSPTVTAEYLGTTDNEDTTRHYARNIAREMAQHGVNVNLAPVVDIKGTTPGLGAIQRCFAADPATITRHARWWIDEHHRAGVLCTLKHFPGHGSAVDDSHWGFVDVTNTWHESELEPYRMLTEQDLADMVMTAHIMNSKLDAEYPATLSKKVLQGLLRDTLHFDGVVVTDDMYMQAIIDKYSIENAIVLAINAGADMLCVGNNISTGYEPDRPFRLVGMIVAAVKDGRIPLERLLEAHERITRLQNKLSQLNN